VDVLFHLVLKDFGIFNIVINTMGKVLNKLTEIAEEYDSMFTQVSNDRPLP
jgi:nucleoside permease NupC